jgi:hypothetical protein
MWKYHEYLKFKGARKIMDRENKKIRRSKLMRKKRVKQRRGKIIGKKKR